ncbi:MAG TPA: sugar isomerase [Euryarchaeota archaeon]|nr:sugar isomerase [Euryarchaeota archaeon]
MELKVKPVLTYGVYQRREATSWRPWGGLQTEEDAKKEARRIEEELKSLSSSASFPLEVLPLSSLRTSDDVSLTKKELSSSDITLIYAAGGDKKVLETLVSCSRWSLIFVRHKSGPLYLWYEVVHPSFLRKRTDNFRQSGMDVDDVVVDESEELMWRLRALYGLKNTLGSKIISIGPPGGWGQGARAVSLAQQRWNLEIITVSYPELERRIKEVKGNSNFLKQAQRQAEEYLSQKEISLETEKKFVVNAFLLHRVFKDLLGEFDAKAITVGECMSTIIPIAETTACLTLSLLNDEGYLAFCESDFVVIPSGILLHHISGKPVFLNDPTYPHNGIVTLAHCTAPRKMDGQNYENARILTHFESDYGAAPKVEFTKGQKVTMIVPDFDEEVWVGFKGKIVGTPLLPICRSQADVEIDGDWRKLLKEMRGFHWMMGYGDYLREVGYALKKAGVNFVTI